MPRYTTVNGVVVDIAQDKADRIPGLKPVSGAAKKAPAKKAAKTAAKKPDDE